MTEWLREVVKLKQFINCTPTEIHHWVGMWPKGGRWPKHFLKLQN